MGVTGLLWYLHTGLGDSGLWDTVLCLVPAICLSMDSGGVPGAHRDLSAKGHSPDTLEPFFILKQS